MLKGPGLKYSRLNSHKKREQCIKVSQKYSSDIITNKQRWLKLCLISQKTTISSNFISLFENRVILNNTFYDLFHHMYMSPDSHMKDDFLSSLINKKL